MKWYGEPMDDFKVKIPKTLPPYTEDGEIEKLFNAIENKKTHKGCIVRDYIQVRTLYCELKWETPISYFRSIDLSR